jgi:hypothetical protein
MNWRKSLKPEQILEKIPEIVSNTKLAAFSFCVKNLQKTLKLYLSPMDSSTASLDDLILSTSSPLFRWKTKTSESFAMKTFSLAMREWKKVIKYFNGFGKWRISEEKVSSSSAEVKTRRALHVMWFIKLQLAGWKQFRVSKTWNFHVNEATTMWSLQRVENY